MDSVQFQHFKMKKPRGFLNFQTMKSFTSLFRLIELILLLILISKLSFPSVRLSTDIFRGAAEFLVSPRFVFFIGNAIVITLFAISRRYNSAHEPISKTTDAVSNDLYQEFLHESEKKRSKVYETTKTEQPKKPLHLTPFSVITTTPFLFRPLSRVSFFFMTPSMASSLSTFLSILLLLSLPLPSTQDLAADKSALLSLRSAVGGRTFLWNTEQTTPCNWTGVACDADRVTALRLPGFALSGNIPEGIFGNLTNLRTLSLRLNALTGTLPLDLGACSDLRRLYLQGNRFSGEIPPFLFGLSNLVRLDLGENEFTGEISSGFKNLTRLKTLYLENNKLSGSLLDLGLGLGLDQFNVSNNSLNGSIPKSLQKFDSDSFLGTSLCGKPLGACSDEGTVPSQPISVGNIPGKRKSKLSGGAIAGIVIGCVVGFLLIVLVLMVLFRRKGDERTRAIDVETIKQLEIEVPEEKTAVEANEPSTAAVNSSGARKLVFFGNATKVFELEDLLRASAEVLGKGTFGTAYKAVLDAATLVAVKRLKDVTMADREFKEKIEVVGAMDHENLVPLRAYYCSGDEKLLVYDFMPMGSLSALLHGNKGAGRSPLDWEVRARIALGAARGLDYLHSQDPLSSHGNVKSSNILLTNSHDARVSDFGLAQLVGSSSTTPNRVTGYRAPEVTDPSRVSQKADVYSFGVVLLELLTGKAPSNSVMNEEGMDLARWVHSVEREEWRREVFDSELMSLERVDSVEGEMEEMLQLGIECTEQHPDKRPVMVEVVRRIQELRQPGSELVD